MTTTSIVDAVAALLPAGRDRALLQATLLPPDRARRAWSDWRRDAGDPDRALRHAFGFQPTYPLLSHSLRVAGVEDPIVGQLRVTQRRETLRMDAYTRAAQDAMDTLRAADIAFATVKGAALAWQRYPDFHLRHCHDLDLWLVNGDGALAETALLSAGFRPLRDGARATVLFHPNGLPIALHTRLIPAPFTDDAERWRSTLKPTTIAGRSTLTLAPEAALVHVAAVATASRRLAHPKTIVDLAMASRGPLLDWDRVVQFAESTGVGAALGGALAYLARWFDGDLPPTARHSLAVSRSAIPAVDVVNFVRPDSSTTLRRLPAMSRAAQALTLRALVAPSRATIRAESPLPAAWWPIWYGGRVVRAVARRAIGSIRRP